MWNKQIYKQLEDDFGAPRMRDAAEVISRMYEIMHLEAGDPVSEYSYEASWWKQKHEQLSQKRA